MAAFGFLLFGFVWLVLVSGRDGPVSHLGLFGALPLGIVLVLCGSHDGTTGTGHEADSGTLVVDDLVTREVCIDGLVFRKVVDGNGNGGLVQVFVPDGRLGAKPKTCRNGG